MGRERMGPGQRSALVWAALLPWAASVLPGALAGTAGKGGWLSPLLALPVLWVQRRAVRRLTGAGERGLNEAFQLRLGRLGAGALTFIYILWAAVLMAVRLRMCVRRLASVSGPGGAGLCAAVTAVLALRLAWGGRAALGRAAVFLYRVLMFALLAIALLTAAQVRGTELWPLWTWDVPNILRGGLLAAGLLCGGIYAAFLEGGEGKDRSAAGCGALALLQLSVLGNFGAALAGRLEDPFLTLAGSVGVEGAFQRVEALASALWLLGDLALLALLLQVCRSAAGKWGRTAAGAALALAGAGALFGSAAAGQWFERAAVPAVNLVLGLCVPVLLAILDGRRGISCARPGKNKADVVEGGSP